MRSPQPASPGPAPLVYTEPNPSLVGRSGSTMVPSTPPYCSVIWLLRA